MPAPLEEMPPHCPNKIEEVTKLVEEVSMQAAADVLHEEADHTPSAVPGCIEIAVNFDNSWNTQGFYSNLAFESAISVLPKEVLD